MSSGVSLSTYLAPDDAEALRARAAAADRSLAGEIRRAVRRYLNDPSASEPEIVPFNDARPAGQPSAVTTSAGGDGGYGSAG